MKKPKLTGAADRAHRRRILFEEALKCITRRDPDSVSDTLALLRSAVSA